MAQKKLEAISGEELMDMRLEPLRFCVDTLLPQGVCVLGGASKIGKSWMVLDWCVRIAKGESVLGQATHGGTTLYLCLEDTCRRVQDRLNRLTDEVPANAYFVTWSETLHQGLLDQIRSFVEEHPDTVLVAVDTLQIIRDTEGDQSYANDYQEIRMLKALADELGITVLVVHHVRKMGDQDPSTGSPVPRLSAVRRTPSWFWTAATVAPTAPRCSSQAGMWRSGSWSFGSGGRTAVGKYSPTAWKPRRFVCLGRCRLWWRSWRGKSSSKAPMVCLLRSLTTSPVPP